MKLVYLLPALLLISAVTAADEQALPTSDLETNNELADALKYGINWIYQHAADKYGVSGENIEVTNVNSLSTWVENGETYYKFDLDSTNNDDANITAKYTVKCDNESNEKKLTRWWYHIDYNTKDDNNESDTYNDNENDNEYTDENEDIGECEFPDAYENVEIDLESEVEVVEEASLECNEVDISELQDENSQARDALKYGVDWIFAKANEKFNISDSGIAVTRVNSVCSYEKDDHTYYNFDVEAQNDNGDNVSCQVSVKVAEDGEKRVVNEWSYKIDYADDTDNEDDNENENDNENDNEDDNEDDQEDDNEDDQTDNYDVEDVEVVVENDYETDQEVENDYNNVQINIDYTDDNNN